MDSNGTWQEEEEQIGKTFINYYEKLFSSSHPVVNAELLEAVQPKLITE